MFNISLELPVVAQTVKLSACNVGDLSSIPGSGRSPGEGNGNPLQYSCMEKYHGWRSMVGYSPWDCKQLDTTEQLYWFTGTYPRLAHKPLYL